MSLFRPRVPAGRLPADRPPTRLTVRLPDDLDGARVVSVHGHYADLVEKGAPVVTLRHGDARHVLAAPRRGQLLPMTGAGDELLAGDALFALHFDTSDAPAQSDLPSPAHTRRQDSRTAETVDQLRARLLPGQRAVSGRGGRGSAPRRLGLQILRGAAAWGLCLSAAVAVLPLVAEFGFAGSIGARLSVMLAALTLGLLLWRWLAGGLGWMGQLLVGTAGAGWVALVVLTLAGPSPLPLGPIPLHESHALALPDRMRAAPPRPSAMLPNVNPGSPGEIEAGSPPAGAMPEQGIRFSARPVEAFALSGRPDPPPQIAMRPAGVLSDPAGRDRVTGSIPESEGRAAYGQGLPAGPVMPAPPPARTDGEGFAVLRPAPIPPAREVRLSPPLRWNESVPLSPAAADRAVGGADGTLALPVVIPGAAKGISSHPAQPARTASDPTGANRVRPPGRVTLPAALSVPALSGQAQPQALTLPASPGRAPALPQRNDLPPGG